MGNVSNTHDTILRTLIHSRFPPISIKKAVGEPYLLASLLALIGSTKASTFTREQQQLKVLLFLQLLLLSTFSSFSCSSQISEIYFQLERLALVAFSVVIVTLFALLVVFADHSA